YRANWTLDLHPLSIQMRSIGKASRFETTKRDPN
ncbi:MAG: hypothetical protein ACI8PT_004824, partial [Gammaproteobacteria bacterium]